MSPAAAITGSAGARAATAVDHASPRGDHDRRKNVQDGPCSWELPTLRWIRQETSPRKIRAGRRNRPKPTPKRPARGPFLGPEGLDSRRRP